MTQNDITVPNANETADVINADTQENASLPTQAQNGKLNAPNIWMDDKALKSAYRAAQYLAQSDLVPEQTYKGKPQNCLIALDISNRMGLSPLLVMSNLFIVRGKPGWSGQFCVAAINGCGRFRSVEYVKTAEDGGTCYVVAKRKDTGEEVVGAKVSMKMANDEGWMNKAGSKWKTMPELMLQYRAAAFFARAYCPDVLLGIQTADEIQDVNGYEQKESEAITVTLDLPKIGTADKEV